jgi:hypothetical protein
VEGYGNVQALVAELHGLGPEVLSSEALERVDPDYPLLVIARGEKAPAS